VTRSSGTPISHVSAGIGAGGSTGGCVDAQGTQRRDKGRDQLIESARSGRAGESQAQVERGNGDLC
jgi:hypothetical protein